MSVWTMLVWKLSTVGLAWRSRWHARRGFGRHRFLSRWRGAGAVIGRVPTCTCTRSLDRCGCPIWSGPVRVCVRLRVHVHVRVRVRSARSSLMARSAFAGAFSIAAPALHPLRASLETRPRRPSIAYAGMHVSDRQLRKADSASACKRTRARTGSTRRSGPRLVWVCLRVRASDCACVCVHLCACMCT